ncbi:MAG: FAD-dependent oxidoreductase [Chloroflexi bacterium]|nr:FAD-dependent oxidoreductase [Chloroflexota bacterium]
MSDRPRVAVIGGGTAGIAAALNLAQRGIGVILIEREAQLGGNASTVCCKAVEGACQHCGGCLFRDHLRALQNTEGIHTFLETRIERVERREGRFLLHGQQAQAKPLSFEAHAVILATGFDPISPLGKGPYGYGLLPHVITGRDLEVLLQARGRKACDDLPLNRVAFIQCVGSRDEHNSRGYCSQVCCRYALRLARVLKEHSPKAEITFFKMDLQTSGRDMAATWAAAKGAFRVIAGLPAILEGTAEGAISFRYEEVLTSRQIREAFDLVVLATGIQPRADAAEVAEQFGLNQDPSGFFATARDGTSTLTPGVFVAGCCQAPRSITESIAHAQEAAQACMRYLQGGAG